MIFGVNTIISFDRKIIDIQMDDDDNLRLKFLKNIEME